MSQNLGFLPISILLLALQYHSRVDSSYLLLSPHNDTSQSVIVPVSRGEYMHVCVCVHMFLGLLLAFFASATLPSEALI